MEGRQNQGGKKVAAEMQKCELGFAGEASAGIKGGGTHVEWWRMT
jgi:hypothetical protein